MVHAPPTVLGPIMGIPQKEVPPLAGARPSASAPAVPPLYTLSGSAGWKRPPFTHCVSNALRTCASVQLIA